MNLKIWSADVINSDDDGDQLYLRLIDEGETIDNNDSDDIHLVVCDGFGEIIDAGCIMVYSQDYRRFVMSSNLNNDTPIKTNYMNEAIVIDSEKLIKINQLKEIRLGSVMANPVLQMIKENLEESLKKCKEEPDNKE